MGVRALARAAGCDAGNLSRILNGRRRVPLELVPALAGALDGGRILDRELARAALEDHRLAWLSEVLMAGPLPRVAVDADAYDDGRERPPSGR